MNGLDRAIASASRAREQAAGNVQEAAQELLDHVVQAAPGRYAQVPPRFVEALRASLVILDEFDRALAEAYAANAPEPVGKPRMRIS